ncbi:MAG: reverse transcriptase family protein, partial [Solirubrobacteraceae bacterium]
MPRRRARSPARGPVIARGWPIATVKTVPEIAERLELDLGQLAWLADVRGLERTAADERLRNYRYRWIPRRSGLPRLIEAPKLRLKEVQRWILREILSQVPAHDAAHGFTRGRSAITHATLHCGQQAVLALDLRDFFPSVPAGRVYGIFRTLGYTPGVAHVLTGLCTNVVALMAWDALAAGGEASGARFHLGRALATPHLPQGAPTSPALANLAAFGLDRRLAGLAAGFELCYSRYADDLTLSGPALGGRRAAAIAQYAS